jgi:hypothetical protein
MANQAVKEMDNIDKDYLTVVFIDSVNKNSFPCTFHKKTIDMINRYDFVVINSEEHRILRRRMNLDNQTIEFIVSKLK